MPANSRNNDYPFGNYLTSLRLKAGLTQRALAYMLGVTDKEIIDII